MPQVSEWDWPPRRLPHISERSLPRNSPEFTQQYSQRLGEAIDELRCAVQRFDRSVEVGETRQGALDRLARSPDELVRRQSAAMAANIARLLGTLQAQKAEMAVSGPFRRIEAFLSNPDPVVAAAT